MGTAVSGRVQRDDHVGWLEHTLAGITSSIERAVFTEEHARSRGWLQAVDPRAKLGMSPGETALLVFSLKQPIFNRIREEFAHDPKTLADETWILSTLLDKLGLRQPKHGIA